jgi:hypothetical protein
MKDPRIQALWKSYHEELAKTYKTKAEYIRAIRIMAITYHKTRGDIITLYKKKALEKSKTRNHGVEFYKEIAEFVMKHCNESTWKDITWPKKIS